MPNRNESVDYSKLQADPLIGLPKAAECFLLLKINNVKTFKERAAGTILFHPTSLQLAFDVRGGTNPGNLVGVNVSFTRSGLVKLIGATKANQLKDPAFRQGMAARNDELADPASRGWAFGRAADNIDAMVIITSGDDKVSDAQIIDAATIVNREADALLAQLGNSVSEFKPLIKGARKRMVGRTRSKAEHKRGHEHFGFLDGVSQPGLRVTSSVDPAKELTPRRNPTHEDGPDVQGLPGQDLLWPGEFVFGYKRQSPNKPITEPGPAEPVADWIKDGSLQVFRRLEQDVGAFWAFANSEGARIGMTAEFFASRLVGRWRSGAPLVRRPDADDPPIGGDEMQNNKFEFGDDSAGLKCPFSAHIRKTYPRDDITPAGAGASGDEEKRELSEQDTQTHRIMRRGIPFGGEIGAADDEGSRGLMFVCYQTEIERQFEFVQRFWANNPNFPPAGQRSGHDIVIGQARTNGKIDQREFSQDVVSGGATNRVKSTTMQEFVKMTGGLYCFMPSISSLQSHFLA